MTFTASATDPGAGQTLTYSLMTAPQGATIDPATGLFSWSPTEEQGPNSYNLTIEVSDGELTDSTSFAITVNEVNLPPTLNAIPDRTVTEGQLLSFIVAASDADAPVNMLTYSLAKGAPSGATIDPSTGLFTFTPTEAQGPAVYPVTVFVTDNGTPTLSDSKTFRLTVMEDSTIDAGPSANDGTPDAFRLVKAGNDGQVFLNGTLIFDQPIATAPSLTFHGSTDNDTLIVDQSAGNSIPASGVTFDGGSGNNTLSVFATDGNDTLTVGHAGTTVTVTLNSSQPINAVNTQNLFIQTAAGNDTVTIRDLSGTSVKGVSVDLGSGNDLFNGSFCTTPLIVYAGAGTDMIYAGIGDEVIYGGTGNKTIYGGIGNEVIYGATGTNLIVGGIGDAVIYGGTGANTIIGGIGNEIIYGGAGTNTIYGGIGNQILYGGIGTNTIYGGIGPEVICGGTDNTIIYGGIGTEAIYKGPGKNSIYKGIGTEQTYDASKKPTNLVSLASSTAGSQVTTAFQQPQNAWLVDFLVNPLKNPVDVNGGIKIVL